LWNDDGEEEKVEAENGEGKKGRRGEEQHLPQEAFADE
jgi:hypothetical protein